MADSVALHTRKYETVAVSQTAQVLGASGKTGDRIEKLIVTVVTSGANGTCSLIDNSGGGAITIALVVSGAPAGVHVIDFGPGGIAATSGGWKVTTGSAATALAIGQFS
jgi:hypothetical protein